MKRKIINPMGQEPELEENPADECNRCDRPWEVQFDGENLCHRCRDKAVAEIRAEIRAANPQIATRAFCAWLKTTSFAGIVQPGERWDTKEAWPSAVAMKSARDCFEAFHAGHTRIAEECMHDAQRAFV